MRITCDNCGKFFNKTPSMMKEHNFCCRSCYAEFRKKHKYVKIVRKKDYSAYNKIKELSRRKQNNEESKV